MRSGVPGVPYSVYNRVTAKYDVLSCIGETTHRMFLKRQLVTMTDIVDVVGEDVGQPLATGKARKLAHLSSIRRSLVEKLKKVE